MAESQKHEPAGAGSCFTSSEVGVKTGINSNYEYSAMEIQIFDTRGNVLKKRDNITYFFCEDNSDLHNFVEPCGYIVTIIVDDVVNAKKKKTKK